MLVVLVVVVLVVLWGEGYDVWWQRDLKIAVYVVVVVSLMIMNPCALHLL